MAIAVHLPLATVLSDRLASAADLFAVIAVEAVPTRVSSAALCDATLGP